MPEVADWQDEFATALTRLNLPAPSCVTNPSGRPSQRRFSIYRNNVLRGLIETLKDMFPATHRIVGEEFFEAMARDYAIAEPPATPVLLEYGGGFAGFVETFEPAASLPYLGDVCRIERAWLEAYHAPEGCILTADELRAVQACDASQCRFRIHPSARLLSSRYPALTIWRTNIDGETPIPVDIQGGGEHVLVVRPTVDVEVRALTHAEMKFIKALFRQQSLLEAAIEALSLDSEFALSPSLKNLIESGVLVGFVVERDSDS